MKAFHCTSSVALHFEQQCIETCCRFVGRIDDNRIGVVAGAGIKSGAPKEPVIGPLLFLLLISDLPSVIKVITLVFADYA